LILAERGWKVLLLGTGTLGEHNFRFPAHPRVQSKAIGFVQRGWRQKWHYARFVGWTLYWTWRWKPQWLYASDPLACPAVWLVRKLSNVRVLYHEHDSLSADAATSWFMKLVFACRQKLGRDADLCVLPQQARLAAFLKATNRIKPTLCVWNCPRLDEITSSQTTKADQLILYYHGSIVPARLPQQLVIAGSRLKGAVRLQIAGYEPSSHGYVKQLQKLAAECGTPKLVEPLGTMSYRKDILVSASRAHVGLSLMPKRSNDINLQYMVGASNKPFDYMACGLPLLVTELPEWISTFVESGYGRACNPDDPDSIETALRWFLDHPVERSEMGVRAQEKIRRDWNYETMFSDVVARLENG
jgi:glycosyltransferase involved in cell wall biosynthesis